MRYEGSVYRPPSEAQSLIVQITIGCAHNRCTFCGMYRDKQFRIRPMQEVLEDLEEARRSYRQIDKIFLADGDAMVLPTNHLLTILLEIKRLFPECRRVGIYATVRDILAKSREELVKLREHGLGIVYIGAETGNPGILEAIQKGATREELILGVKKSEDAGIQASVTFISGMGGKEHWKEHALDTASMISEMEPSYVGLLTLMVEPGTPLYEEIQQGKFTLLSAEEVLLETEELLQYIQVEKTCVFRSNHASNYLSLAGDLPQDKEAMLKEIRMARQNKEILKNERFRML